MFLLRIAKRRYLSSISRGLIRPAWIVPALLALLSLLGMVPGPTTLAEGHPAGAPSPLPFTKNVPLASHYAKLTADNGEENDYLGFDLASSGDTLIARALRRDIGDNLDQGAVYVFARDPAMAGAWRQAAELIDADGEQWDQFGSGVAISGDTVVVGNSSQGEVCIFGRDQGGPGAWGLVTRLTEISAGEAFGSSVAIDGDTLFVGAISALVGDQAKQGAVYVFARNQGGPDAWGQVARLVSDEGGSDDQFGTALDVDGDTLVVGARWEDVDGTLNEGAAYVFAHGQGGPGDWVQVARLSGKSGEIDQDFGLDVAVDGDTIAVSAPFENALQGAVYVFGRNQGGPDAWGRVSRLTRCGGQGWSQFGLDLALQGETLVATESKIDWVPNTITGAVCVFARNWGGPDAWGQLARLTADDGTSDDWFGAGLTINEDTISAGAPKAKIGDNRAQGAVYLFEHMDAVGRVYLPFVVRNFSNQDCEENLDKVKVWVGTLNWQCDTVVKKVGQSSLRLETDVFSNAEVYSPLIPVTPGQVHSVSYWVKTDLTVDDATVYGRIVAAQYTAQAQEGDEVNENRIDSGFLLGENAGGTADWAKKSYSFTTTAETRYVRLRAPIGLSGRAKGRVWFDGVSLEAMTK